MFGEVEVSGGVVDLGTFGGTRSEAETGNLSTTPEIQPSPAFSPCSQPLFPSS